MDQAEPDPNEVTIRRDGRLSLFGGVALAAVDVAGSAVVRFVADRDAPYELFLTVMAVAVVAVVHGLQERAGRNGRAVDRVLLDSQRRILEAVDVIPTILIRVEAVEDVVVKLPGYPEGVLEGVELAKRVRIGDR